MLTVEVTEKISCTPDELLECVMDVERYAQVDRKIRPVQWARRDGNLTEFCFRPRLVGIPAAVSGTDAAHARQAHRHHVGTAACQPNDPDGL